MNLCQTCIAEQVEHPVHAAGLCRKHYERARYRLLTETRHSRPVTPLLRWRREAGLGQRALSRLTGYSLGIVYQLEQGLAPCGPKRQRHIAASVGVPVETIFGSQQKLSARSKPRSSPPPIAPQSSAQ